jgi:hypothetical protein
VVDEEDAKAIILNSLPSKYNNVIFTLSQLPSQSLEDMIVALLAKEKRTIAGDTKGDTQLRWNSTQETIITYQLKTRGR